MEYTCTCRCSVELCALSLISLSLCLIPDPRPTPEKLSNVLGNMPDDLWLQFGRFILIPESKRNEVQEQYSSTKELKQAIIDLLASHPALSWTLVAHALYHMAPWLGERCHRLLDHLQQKFPTGNSTTNSPI